MQCQTFRLLTIVRANQEINNVREQFKAQISVLSAKLKKSELELGQLQRQLEAKVQDAGFKQPLTLLNRIGTTRSSQGSAMTL